MVSPGPLACDARTVSPPPPWSLLYADGSANAFRFDATAAGVTFAYEPVTPARSSSGVYDGGTPRAAHVGLDDPRVRSLWALIEALVADRASHAAARAKGDGAIRSSRRARRGSSWSCARPRVHSRRCSTVHSARRPGTRSVAAARSPRLPSATGRAGGGLAFADDPVAHDGAARAPSALRPR